MFSVFFWIAQHLTKSNTAEGGSISLAAGDAFYDYYHRNQRSEMIGGSVTISAGSSNGPTEKDVGGSLLFTAGSANYGVGGSINITSGGSKYDSSMLSPFIVCILSVVQYSDLLSLHYTCRWQCGDWFC